MQDEGNAKPPREERGQSMHTLRIITNAGRRRRNAVNVAAIAAAAFAVTSPRLADAGVTNDAGFSGPGSEFVVSTSGATALGAFTRARNADNSYNRGPLSLGGSQLRIGR